MLMIGVKWANMATAIIIAKFNVFIMFPPYSSILNVT
jgi:hypothetical protein